MTRLMLLCGAVLMTLPTATRAKDFPLEFKTLTADEAMAFPGGSGLYGMLQLDKPGGIQKAPPAVSRHPLYGELSLGSTRYGFRLDESRGDGQGYDRLIVDVNQNGDLTDDAVARRVDEARPASASSIPEVALFGPISAPEAKRIGSGQPIYFAQLYLFARPSGANASARNVFFGQLRFKAGWYLETTVELDGITQKVGIVDANCSFSLGQLSQPTFYKNGNETNWYFQDGDSFLKDNDGSGKFEVSVADDEASPFGPVLYLGAKPYKAALAGDCKSLSVDPWIEPLARLSLQPHGKQVFGVRVAWENSPGRWQVLESGVDNGQVMVPPGNYRLYTCTLKAKTSAGDTLVLNGYKRTLQETTKAEADAVTPFRCGSPLEIKVTSTRDTRNISQSAGAPRSLLGRIADYFTSSEPPVQQLIQASVVGAGGETYSSFTLRNSKGLSQPPKPTFTVTTADGKQVGSGNLEFG